MSNRWTEEEAKAYGFRKNAKGEWESPPVQSKLLQTGDSGFVPEPKRRVRKQATRPDKAETPGKGESKRGDKFRIVVTSYRKRHADPDNLCPKWYIDEIVSAKIIPDDLSKYITSVEKRVRVTKNEPKTVIEIFKHEVY
jgi:hypothetical protein